MGPRLHAARLSFHPLTPERWPDLVRLFGSRGACAGCWCMYWRRSAKQWNAGKGAGNRRAFHRVVRAGPPPGVLAYLGDEVIGWCAIAPREVYDYLSRSRVLKPVDDRPVWSVSCLFVQRAQRRRGLSARLLQSAVDFAAGLGARVIEGYPVEPRKDRSPDAFLWTGTAAAFRRAGFREVARHSETRPIMRRFLRARRNPG